MDEADRGEGLFEVRIDVPALPRIRDAIRGGDGNFPVDRTVAEEMAHETPHGLGGLQASLDALDRFLVRAMRAIAAESDVRQVIHFGSGTPEGAMVHEYVRAVMPDARVVYVSYDTTTLAHVHKLWRGAPAGSVGHVQSRWDDPDEILRGASDTLDLTAPVAVVLPSILNMLADDAALRLVDGLRADLAVGSYLVMAVTSVDIHAEGIAEVIEMLNDVLAEPFVSRSEAEAHRYMEGFDLLEPGVVPGEHWRSDGDPPALPDGQTVPHFVGVGRKTRD